jgi:hypothetical protein
MYILKTKRFELKLEVVPVETLRPHEATLPHVIDILILEFKNWANLQSPIIVDENHIVLDGNHRAHAFKKLGFRYILVCMIDYLNDHTGLRYWFRLLGNVKGFDMLRKIIEDLGGRFQEVTDRGSLQDTLECNRLCCGVQHGDIFASVSFEEEVVYDSVSAYEVLEEIQIRLIREGIELKYIPCQYVQSQHFCEELKKDEMIIWTPQITKEMVVEAAKEKKLFAPKTTRHLIPARPLNVDLPTRWLSEDISREQINERVSRFLSAKQVKRFGPGQVIDGRYYEEELFVFFDKKT